MIDLWLAPMRAMADLQRQALAMMLPPPAAAVTFPGDLMRAALPWAAFWPVWQVAGGVVPLPWAGLAVRAPMGTCGMVTVGGRR